MKYRFKGKITYNPRNDREYHFVEEKFRKVVDAKTLTGAELKLQAIMMAHVKHPVERFRIDYEVENEDNREKAGEQNDNKNSPGRLY